MTGPAAQATPVASGGPEPIPPPSSSAPPGAPPGGAPFHSALEAEWARTANAEGHQQSHSQSPTRATPRETRPRGERGTDTNAGAAVSAPPSPANVTPTRVMSSADAQSADVPAGGTHGVPGALTPPNTPGATTPRDTPGAATAPGTPEAATPPNTPGATTLPNTPGATTPRDTPGAATAPGMPEAATPPSATGAVTPPSTPATHNASGLPLAIGLDGSSATANASATPGTLSNAAVDADAFKGAGSDPGRTGSDPGRAGSDPLKTSPPLPSPGAPSATLGSPAHLGTAGNNNGGDASSPQAGLHRSAEQGLHSADGTAHDKLWVPDPGQASMGTADTGASAGGAGGLAAAGDSAQASAQLAGGSQEGPLLDSGVGLQQAIETLHGTIELTARQGLSQARIALEPAGLGEIRIHLTQTAQGLLARVTAETPAAAQALAAAHAELRQSLSSLGLNLARLAIGRHGQSSAQGGGTALGSDRHDGAAGSGEASSRGNRSGQSLPTPATTDPGAETGAEEDTQPEPAPAHGALVDVLA